MSETTVHATTVCLDGRTVMITGESGCGKTSLALMLLRRAHTGAVSASLVADDYTIITARGGRLFAACPDALKGKVEIRGLGIIQIQPYEGADCALELVVELTTAKQAVRFYDGAMFNHDGVSVKLLKLEQGQNETCANAILCALGLALTV